MKHNTLFVKIIFHCHLAVFGQFLAGFQASFMPNMFTKTENEAINRPCWSQIALHSYMEYNLFKLKIMFSAIFKQTYAKTIYLYFY